MKTRSCICALAGKTAQFTILKKVISLIAECDKVLTC
jgi:hypothetical protein